MKLNGISRGSMPTKWAGPDHALNRDISETALPITETKNGDHFAIQSIPQNVGKLTSETTFGHSKVVFRPLLRTKRAFSQNPLMARF